MRRSGHGTATELVVIGVQACVLAVFGFWSLRERQFLLVDDAYIAFRYAANWADGLGIVWNAGERVEGYTSLSWVAVLSMLSKLGIDLTWPAIASSFAFAVGSIALTTRIARAQESGAPAAVVAALLLASNASFAHAATSGMETTAFGFAVLLAIHWLIRARERSERLWHSAVCFGVACLTRPEGLLITAVAIAVEFRSLGGTLAQRTRRLAPIAGLVTAVFVMHVLARLVYYGYPFPNTFYAKVIFGPTTVLRGIVHVSGFLLAGGFIALPGLFDLRRNGRLRPWLLHGYCLLGTYTAYLVVIGGDHPHWYRFYVPLMPLPFLGTAEWMTRVARMLGQRLKERVVPGMTRLAFFTACVAAASTLSTAYGERRELVGRVSPRDADVMRTATSFFRTEAPPKSFVAAAAVGHVGYYARSLHILDIWGLNDVHIAHLRLPPSTKFGHDKFDVAYVSRMKPDYAYVLLPLSPPPPLPGYDLCWHSRNYPIAVYRRNFALAPEEAALGLKPPERRSLTPPPICRPP